MAHQHHIPRSTNAGPLPNYSPATAHLGGNNGGGVHHNHNHHNNNNSNFFGNNNNNSASPFDEGSMMMQMGLQFGNKIIDEGKGRLSSIETSDLRKRFGVTHEFVVGKLKLLAFPFRQKFLRSGEHDSSASLNGNNSSMQQLLGGDNIDLLAGSSSSTTNLAAQLDPATGDVLAHDLYLPLMSLITYVVFCAFGKGMTSAQLSPTELATTVTASTVLVVFETVVIKIWRMITSLPPPIFFDTIALFGYFFVNVCYALLARALFEAWLYPVSWALTFYFLGAFTFFMYKSLADTFDKDGSLPKRAMPILYAATLIQAPLFLWFVRRAY